MPEYIDKEKLIASVVNTVSAATETTHDFLTGSAYRQNEIIDIIKEQPAADVVEVVRFKEEIAQPYLLINCDDKSVEVLREALKKQKPVILPDNEAAVEFLDKASIRAEAVKEVIARVKEYFNPDISFEFRKWLDSLEKELVGEG